MLPCCCAALLCWLYLVAGCVPVCAAASAYPVGTALRVHPGHRRRVHPAGLVSGLEMGPAGQAEARHTRHMEPVLCQVVAGAKHSEVQPVIHLRAGAEDAHVCVVPARPGLQDWEECGDRLAKHWRLGHGGDWRQHRWVADSAMHFISCALC